MLYSQDLIGQIERVSGKEIAADMYESGRLLGGEACMWAEKGKKTILKSQYIRCSHEENINLNLITITG